jgi:Uma2 family endonuclease
MSITKTAPMTEEAFGQFSLGDRSGQWELVRGQLREKPGMSVEHGDIMMLLTVMLHNQLDRQEFRVRVSHARLRRSADTYDIPDVAVVPAAVERALRQCAGSLDAYSEPLPLVVEIWSPSTGNYDVGEKAPDYQRRGDLEIWRIHPYERNVTAWRRQPDGTYAESVLRGGTVHPVALPGVAVDLDALFAEA